MPSRKPVQTIRLVSFPSDLPGELSERPARRAYPSRSTCFSWAPTSQKAACRRRIRQRISQWLHDVCATGPPTSRPQPRRRPFPFSRKLRARFPRGLQKPTHERNGHERFLEQARQQTRKRPPQPSPTSIATRKEEPWARNTTEESEPTKGS